ncbi:unnamed protein product [Bursaphelenchus xylophilus]|uniref:(pine wood nematode) hypothetical protein n=1 Tax=Bursaphelenchus xylophilus TaxID=6326 RepID=A0A1I7SHZ6_BURXY|nr:unnamed protein product [Bursaphelenchus xylophilus]CAG9129507.1 unnamed protein product [Bursaphelenchus xylophilus]
MTETHDPHFENIVNELNEVTTIADKLVFYSVYLRPPAGSKDKGPNPPADALSKVDSLTKIETTLKKISEIDEKLDQIETDNPEVFTDQVEDYRSDLEDLKKRLKNLKQVINYELLNEGDPSKSEGSWLTTYKNLLGAKLHKEKNALEEIQESETKDQAELQTLCKRLDRIVQTAAMLQEAARYLHWFTNRIVEANEALPDSKKDYTLELVAGWMRTELDRVKDHEQNCFNVKSELEGKLFEKTEE